jgi:hypothetical protein
VAVRDGLAPDEPFPTLVRQTGSDEPMESQMSTQVMSQTRYPSRTRFVLVNDRTPRADAYCALCCEPIEQGYVREPQTRLLYCDVQCFAGHEKMAMLTIEKRARKVS